LAMGTEWPSHGEPCVERKAVQLRVATSGALSRKLMSLRLRLVLVRTQR
jgi:hypothetical protein